MHQGNRSSGVQEFEGFKGFKEFKEFKEFEEGRAKTSARPGSC
jgi:mannose-6-phosphate isomerase class I